MEPDAPSTAPAPAPPTQKPTIGRIVLYRVTPEQAAAINERRRLSGATLTGNIVSAGDTFPCVVVRPWSDTCLNGQALLDGNDSLWVLSANLGDEPGNWNWPPRA
jgi:hypothetical protein